MLSDPLFVFQLMKLPMNASCSSPARPWLVLRSLRGYCIQAPFFYVAMFETRATPYATRLNSWRVIRRILWYVYVMAKKARSPHLTWRFSQVCSNCRRAHYRPRLASHDSTRCGQCLTWLPWQSAACRWVARVNLSIEHWLLSVTAVCRCATPTSVGKSQEAPWLFWWLVRIISKGGECDGFDASSCLRLHWLVRLLITCRVE